jgi:hypothetical protein
VPNTPVTGSTSATEERNALEVTHGPARALQPIHDPPLHRQLRSTPSLFTRWPKFVARSHFFERLTIVDVSPMCEHVFVAGTVGTSHSAHDVRSVVRELRRWVGALDPDAVAVFEAPELWAAYNEVEQLAASAKTLLARRVEQACTWKAAGFRSAAEQLAVTSGTSVTAAKNMLETSKQIEELPATAQAMRAGRLSPAKAQVIASTAAINPAAEEHLVGLAATAPFAEVRNESLRARAGVDRDAAHARIHAERSFHDWTDAEGKWRFAGQGTLEDGARFHNGHGPIVNELFKAAREEGRKEPAAAYAFDAVIELARRAVGAGTPDPGAKPPRTVASCLALIRVDLAALQHGAVEGEEICEIAGLGPIPVSVARELLGESIMKLVITKGIDVLNVTHLGRSATVAQDIALRWQSPRCRVLGCTRTKRLEIDHRTGWIKTHTTCLDDLDPLCEHHDDLKTYDGWSLVKRPRTPPHGPTHRPPPPQLPSPTSAVN